MNKKQKRDLFIRFLQLISGPSLRIVGSCIFSSGFLYISLLFRLFQATNISARLASIRRRPSKDIEALRHWYVLLLNKHVISFKGNYLFVPIPDLMLMINLSIIFPS